jgi:outer membrane protein assembly factor BamB
LKPFSLLRGALFRLILPCLAPLALTAQVDVLTQHNDVGRTGANLQERTLTPARVRSGFGKIAELEVDGDIYTQPLYVSKAHLKGMTHNVVIVATMHNTVYAFDADKFFDENGRKAPPLWKRSLEPAVQLESIEDWIADCGQEPARNIPLNMGKEIGIVGSPVISLENQTLYLVTFTAVTIDKKKEYQHFLHALDLLTGADRANAPAVKISATGFTSRLQNQRPGLLLTKGDHGGLYVAFGSYGDCGGFHGWIFGYDPQQWGQSPAVFNSTPGDATIRGGIWQAGQGPAADSAGNIYVMSGNGDFDSQKFDPSKKQDFGNSFIKLSPNLLVLDRFTPHNAKALNEVDGDLGSGGPLLIPGTNLLIGGGKEGKLYVLNRDNMGGFDPDRDGIVQSFQATTGQCPQWAAHYSEWPKEGCPEPAPAKHADGGYHHIHGSPVYWKSRDGAFIYVWGEADTLRRFKFIDDKFKPEGTSEVTTPTRSMSGALLSISAQESRNGIVWATHPTGCICDPRTSDCTMTKYWCDANENVVPGTLRAMDASTLKELWNSDRDRTDPLGNVAKFTPVTVANGKVYVATLSNKLVVYGLRHRSSAP